MGILKKVLIVVFVSVSAQLFSQEMSIARQWMDILLHAIEEDGQGPTIQARNLFHTSAAMYDAWAAYSNDETYFLGKDYHGFHLEFDRKKIGKVENIDSLRQIAISYAAFRVLRFRHNDYASKSRTIDFIEAKMLELGYDMTNYDQDYTSGSPEALGNYIANYIIELGHEDGSREDDRHESEDYDCTNRYLRPELPGVGYLSNPNGWQPINIKYYVERKGNDQTLKDWNYLLIPGNTNFLTSFWGDVLPFALPEKETEVNFDPGKPPFFSKTDSLSMEKYRWGFQLVQDWSGAMSSENTTMWDVSPKGITSMEGHMPVNFEEYQTYYNAIKVNKRPQEKAINPTTKTAYTENIVKQGDYCRVIAEFWVDGPNTKSPPGHWVQFLNEVSYHPDFKRQWNGKGKPLDQLEWDVKSYLLMTGTAHDAAITCWGIKSYYDYVRPITAIRYMGGLGQSSDSLLPNYSPYGLKLKKGSCELVRKRDPLVGKNKENLNKVKIYAWKGPDEVEDQLTDYAGTGWILAENWWPYQRYSFATPPFAGYISGHSTFSTASAEILTYISGSPYFPNGLKTMTATKNEFLGFEEGPSETLTLQWATFYDAAIETCLSRVWGGIHPPVDDIEGRKVGKKVAENSIKFSKKFFK